MISIAASYCFARGIEDLYFGAHSGDHAIYPDCRPEFYESMAEAIRLGTDGEVVLAAPFLDMNKKQVLEFGYSYNPPVPYELTRTCYKEQEVACGKCGACQERLEAFKGLNVTDPIEYEDW